MSLYPDAVAPLLAALIDLRDNGPTSPAEGICLHIDSYMHQTATTPTLRHQADRLRHHLMETWPDSSGDTDFPVDGYKEYYIIANTNKWSNHRRLQLLNWMIAQLEGYTQQ